MFSIRPTLLTAIDLPVDIVGAVAGHEPEIEPEEEEARRREEDDEPGDVKLQSTTHIIDECKHNLQNNTTSCI